MESDNSYSIIQTQSPASSSMNASWSYQAIHSQRSVFRPSVPRLSEASELPEVPEFNYRDDEPLAEQEHVALAKELSEKDARLDDAIKLSLRLKNKTIRLSSSSVQTFPLLASLVTDKIPSSKKAAIDLVCVIDKSSSMHGQSIEFVKQTFDYLLQYLDDKDRLSIVLFNNDASRLIPLMKTTEEGKQKILSVVKTIDANGGTNISLGMVHAFQILKQRRQKNSVSSIFLLSDGLDEGAQQRIKTYLTQIGVPDDVSIHTFGFSKEHDPHLMNDIAALRDGSFYFVKELDTISEAFVDCLGGLISTIAQKVILKILPCQSPVLQSVNIVKVYGDEEIWHKDGQTYIIKASNLVSERQKDFVLELQITIRERELQSVQKDVVIAKAEAEITGLDGNTIIKKIDLHANLVDEAEEMKDRDEDDKEVMKNYYRVRGASIIDEARKFATQRKYEGAKKILQIFKDELEDCSLKEEAFVKNLILDITKTMENSKPEIFDNIGKHEMLSTFRAQMYQKSNFGSANCYQNKIQTEMVKQVRDKKNNKTLFS